MIRYDLVGVERVGQQSRKFPRVEGGGTRQRSGESAWSCRGSESEVGSAALALAKPANSSTSEESLRGSLAPLAPFATLDHSPASLVPCLEVELTGGHGMARTSAEIAEKRCRGRV